MARSCKRAFLDCTSVAMLNTVSVQLHVCRNLTPKSSKLGCRACIAMLLSRAPADIPALRFASSHDCMHRRAWEPNNGQADAGAHMLPWDAACRVTGQNWMVPITLSIDVLPPLPLLGGHQAPCLICNGIKWAVNSTWHLCKNHRSSRLTSSRLSVGRNSAAQERTSFTTYMLLVSELCSKAKTHTF